ncbi:MAG: sugar phosphate nucleotidyltransferase [Lachnospiraceae bacterium]|nr:sugar phosphate nucleotidyltransferase [Lachnospiraceae bacterium]
MKKTTLVVMAAGIGSRFGKGIKQLEPLGPGGQIIMDYSVHDAIEAGFDDVVFIIRRDLEKDFREIIGSRMEKKIHVKYAFQERDDLPEGFSCPKDRTKPWGTGQAVLAAADVIDAPFAVINADDYYGKEPFRLLHDYLAEDHDDSDGVEKICMAGFRLGNTLSDNGGVTRGLCNVDARGRLVGIDETKNIVRTADGAAVRNEDGSETPLDPGRLVSMNMWGLQPDFIDILRDGFRDFLEKLPEEDLKSEYLLPVIIDRLLKENRAEVSVLETAESWFGVTYQEDKDAVKASFRRLTEQGVYTAVF